MINYEKQVAAIERTNEKYLNLFKNELIQKKLSEKTINRHLNTVRLYLNDFLCYYEPKDMKHGCYELDFFMCDWIIRKCGCLSSDALKSTVASIKKFYHCMFKANLIETEDYDFLTYLIKEQMEDWILTLQEYNSDL
ncbi:MAG: hypothetical protein RSC93_12135 [Erysipelotrichaceae bacterium]